MDMGFPTDCEDLFIPVLCSTATACKQLQHLAMTGAHWGFGDYMGADVRTRGLFCRINVHAGHVLNRRLCGDSFPCISRISRLLGRLSHSIVPGTAQLL